MYCRHCRQDVPVQLFRCMTKSNHTRVYKGCGKCRRQLVSEWVAHGPLTIALEEIPIGKDYRPGAILNRY